jgi:hypothetical protein
MPFFLMVLQTFGNCALEGADIGCISKKRPSFNVIGFAFFWDSPLS